MTLSNKIANENRPEKVKNSVTKLIISLIVKSVTQVFNILIKMMNAMVGRVLLPALLITQMACSPVPSTEQGEHSQAGVKAVNKEASQVSNTPNIVLILTDDQGWGDLSIHGNSVLQTPNIDSIGKQGVSFERFYVNPVCASTRAALLTGRQPLRTGVFGVTRGSEKMRESEITLAEMLKKQGYNTGLFGKWHNGAQFPHDPNGQGFDESFGIVNGHQTLYFDANLMANGKAFKTKGYIADVITNAAIEFIKGSQNKPFFAYVPFNTPHSPFEVPDKYFNKFKSKGATNVDAAIYGMMENIDDNIGRILNALQELQLDKNTIVLYLSDNGPVFPDKTIRFNGGLKGSKGKVDEGGVRSPFLVHWPGKISGGKSIKWIAQHVDVVPTLMALVGGELPNDRKIDGMDISPLLLAKEPVLDWPDRTLFTHHIQNTKINDKAISSKRGAVRTQKYLATYPKDGRWYLYDIETDEQQKVDISKQQPAILEQLKQKYFSFYQDISSSELQTIATEIGHNGYDYITLPAHEAFINGEGIAYAHGAGWSHDWINVKPAVKNAQISWPIKVIKQGKYRIGLQYASKNELASVTGSINIFGQQYPLSVNLKKFIPHVDKGSQRHPTNEAPELTWNLHNLGEFEFAVADGQLAIGLTQLPKVAKQQVVLIKGITLTRI
jgi:arylsulfatase A